MNLVNERFFQANPKLLQKMLTLIIGRLFVIFVLLGASWIWNSKELNFNLDEFPQSFFIVFFVAVGLTLLYFAFLQFNKNYRWQIWLQFLIDSALITWLIWETGVITSPYLILYILLIGVAGVFLSSRGTLLIAVICVVQFTTLSILIATSVMTFKGVLPDYLKIIQIVGLNDAAFLFVGLLSSRLSARKLSGAKLKATAKTLANLRMLHERIVESIRSGLITTDLNGSIYTFNSTAQDITGYTEAEMQGKSIFDLFGNIRRPIQVSLEAAEKSENMPRFNIDLVTPDDTNIHIGYSIAPLFLESGEKKGLIITFQDLTDIRTMQENILRKDRLAAVGRVAAGLAHEIRNPLGAMRGAIQVLESSTPPNSSQASLMQIILKESDRLNKIITNFLTYASPRITNFSKVDLRESIEDTFTLLKHSPDVKENHILKAELPDEPIIIDADPTQLKQIFWNLARNAIMAMPDGGNLLISASEMQNKRIRILFEDTGCGMSPKQVEQLFEPFSQSTTGGTGLGLSIVYQIVRDHYGTINVRSTEDKGTTITVELPLEMKNPVISPNSRGEDYRHTGTRIEQFLSVKEEE
jgi:two-component system sensor histidine kinase PilS (NtrC family)